MPPDSDADSRELIRNIVQLLESIEQDTRQRNLPTAEVARRSRLPESGARGRWLIALLN